mmetsp:Transcript_16308/g.27564  ORF Transcript_16308/g.27564 Transcript_16308/m.27564 type:complete len:237 (+) Transcript_16308:1-711(+)
MKHGSTKPGRGHVEGVSFELLGLPGTFERAFDVFEHGLHALIIGEGLLDLAVGLGERGDDHVGVGMDLANNLLDPPLVRVESVDVAAEVVEGPVEVGDEVLLALEELLLVLLDLLPLPLLELEVLLLLLVDLLEHLLVLEEGAHALLGRARDEEALAALAHVLLVVVPSAIALVLGLALLKGLLGLVEHALEVGVEVTLHGFLEHVDAVVGLHDGVDEGVVVGLALAGGLLAGGEP